MNKMKCRWCDREGAWPKICMNTRDMEDRAISGDDTCFGALERRGGGEKGMRYVVLNREAERERRTGSE